MEENVTYFVKGKLYPLDEWIEGRNALPAEPTKIKGVMWEEDEEISKTFKEIFGIFTSDIEKSCLTPAEIAKISHDNLDWFSGYEKTNWAIFLFKKDTEYSIAIVRRKNGVLHVAQFPFSGNLLYLDIVKYRVVVAV